MSLINYILIFIIWFIWSFQHSFFAQVYFKNKIRIYLGENFEKYFYRFLYFYIQCVIFPIFWNILTEFDGGNIIYSLNEDYFWILFIINKISFLLLIWSVISINTLHFIGLSQLIQFFDKKEKFNMVLPNEELEKKFLYKFVRHPMYFSIFLYYMSHTVTYDEKYFFNFFCLILYTNIGVYFEEKQLSKKFGSLYDEYKKQVPKLIPKIKII
tara:strand:+ start:6012 stop:6647 length:636 start_codon:yes stop_codon:yes gene_type:complete